MVGIAGDAHIVICIQTQLLCETLWRIFLAVVGEGLWALAEIGVIDSGKGFFPYWGEFLQSAIGDSIYYAACHCIKLSVNRQCVGRAATVLDTRHGLLWYETVVLEAVYHIIC